MIEQKIENLIEESFSYLEEMRAVDRRKSALDYGIIPQGNWKSLERQARKGNTKNIDNMRQINKNAHITQKHINNLGVSSTKEWGGVINEKNPAKLIRPLNLGTDTGTSSTGGRKISDQNFSSIHSHPYKPNTSKIMSFLRTEPSGSVTNDKVGDLASFRQNLKFNTNNNGQKSRSDYIVTPLNELGEISRTRTYEKKVNQQASKDEIRKNPLLRGYKGRRQNIEPEVKQHTSYIFGGKPNSTKFYYNLNGQYRLTPHPSIIGNKEKIINNNWEKLHRPLETADIKNIYHPNKSWHNGLEQASLLNQITGNKGKDLLNNSKSVNSGKTIDNNFFNNTLNHQRKSTLAMGPGKKIIII
jgi:hypothetical protein